MSTLSTSLRGYLGIDVAKLKLDVVLLLEERHTHRIFALPHENLPLSASSISIPAIPFWSLLLGRCFAHQL